jgi:oligoendopeptidase F
MIAARRRQAQAVELRVAGASLDAIAAKLGYTSASAAYRAIETALQRTIQAPADSLRELELRRLDVLMLAIWNKARKGDLDAVDRAIRIIDRRAKLLGLDAPQRVDIAGYLRDMAKDQGFDGDEAVEIAQQMLRGLR